ncbi:MAG: DUF5752 family protein [Acidobacteriota bacterium]
MSFKIKDCALSAIATDFRAHNLSELRNCLVDVPPASVYYHFWGCLLRPRFDDPEYINDFAVWAYRALHDVVLAERLSIVDPTEFSDLELLRTELLEILEERLDESEWVGWAPAGSPFHFLRSQIVVFDTNRRVESPQELFAALPSLSGASVFYHFIDARRRNPEGIDDFRAWMADLGDEFSGLCHDLAGLDPYFMSLIALRDKLADVLSRHVGGGAA